ncbi:hypothetical protein HK101_005668 [Irineochytrium annulatum]|nr:hypothetical protein HK101_005668 [Irineochytrium annulatum]
MFEQIFHGNYQSDDGATFPDFWTLKELEKMGPKYKGIVGNTVKDVLDSLVVSFPS